MKAILLFYVIVFSFNFQTNAQQFSYSRIVDPNNSEATIYLQQVIQAPHHGFFAIGYSRWGSYTGHAGIAISIDSVGNVNWAKKFDYSQQVKFYTAMVRDTEFYIGGELYGNDGALFLSIDKSGNLLSSKVIQNTTFPLQLKQFFYYKNKLIAHCGELFQISSSGTFSNFGNGVLVYGRVFVDSNYIYFLGGPAGGLLGCAGKGFIAKINENGETIWLDHDVKLQGNAYTGLINGFVNPDRSLTIFGHCTNDFCSEGKTLVLYLDSNGVEISHKAFSNEGREVSDFFFKENGTTISYVWSADTTFLVVVFDTNQEVVWSQKYFPQKVCRPQSVVSDSASIAIAGWVEIPPLNGFINVLPAGGSGCNDIDFTMVSVSKPLAFETSYTTQTIDTSYTITDLSLTSEDLVITSGCDIPLSNSELTTVPLQLQISPNPFSNFISVTSPFQSTSVLSAITPQGKIIMEMKLLPLQTAIISRDQVGESRLIFFRLVSSDGKLSTATAFNVAIDN